MLYSLEAFPLVVCFLQLNLQKFHFYNYSFALYKMVKNKLNVYIVFLNKKHIRLLSN